MLERVWSLRLKAIEINGVYFLGIFFCNLKKIWGSL
jgi:hypothetical protein